MERRVRRLPLTPKKMFSVWNIMAMPAAPFLFWVREILGYLLYRVLMFLTRTSSSNKRMNYMVDCLSESIHNAKLRNNGRNLL